MNHKQFRELFDVLSEFTEHIKRYGYNNTDELLNAIEEYKRNNPKIICEFCNREIFDYEFDICEQCNKLYHYDCYKFRLCDR